MMTPKDCVALFRKITSSARTRPYLAINNAPRALIQVLLDCEYRLPDNVKLVVVKGATELEIAETLINSQLPCLIVFPEQFHVPSSLARQVYFVPLSGAMLRRAMLHHVVTPSLYVALNTQKH